MIQCSHHFLLRWSFLLRMFLEQIAKTSCELKLIVYVCVCVCEYMLFNLTYKMKEEYTLCETNEWKSPNASKKFDTHFTVTYSWLLVCDLTPIEMKQNPMQWVYCAIFECLAFRCTHGSCPTIRTQLLVCHVVDILSSCTPKGSGNDLNPKTVSLKRSMEH